MYAPSSRVAGWASFPALVVACEAECEAAGSAPVVADSEAMGASGMAVSVRTLRRTPLLTQPPVQGCSWTGTEVKLDLVLQDQEASHDVGGSLLSGQAPSNTRGGRCLKTQACDAGG